MLKKNLEGNGEGTDEIKSAIFWTLLKMDDEYIGFVTISFYFCICLKWYIIENLKV